MMCVSQAFLNTVSLLSPRANYTCVNDYISGQIMHQKRTRNAVPSAEQRISFVQACLLR